MSSDLQCAVSRLTRILQSRIRKNLSPWLLRMGIHCTCSCELDLKMSWIKFITKTGDGSADTGRWSPSATMFSNRLRNISTCQMSFFCLQSVLSHGGLNGVSCMCGSIQDALHDITFHRNAVVSVGSINSERRIPFT